MSSEAHLVETFRIQINNTDVDSLYDPGAKLFSIWFANKLWDSV